MALVRVSPMNLRFQSDSLITQELVPSLFVESVTQSSLKLVQPVF